MKTVTIILLTVVIMFSAGCTKKAEVNRDKVLIDSLATIAVEAFNSGNIEKALSIYSNDIVFLNGPVKMSSKDSLAIGFKYMFQHMKNFNYYPGFSSVSKDLIFSEGMFTFDWQVDNSISFAKGVMILVYSKQPDNSWKITYCEENHGDLPIK